MAVVFIFPGQSSRYVGMLDKLVDSSPACGRILAEASDLLSWDLGAQFLGGDPNCFRRNVDVQVSVFVANHMHLQTLRSHGIEAGLSLGLSLGEYNHLVHIGALSFADALRLVRSRGEAYDAGPRGSMASIQPISATELEVALQAMATPGQPERVLEISNRNSPRQQVISGHSDAVEKAVLRLEQEHYVQAQIIEREAPMHSSLFRSVGDAFRPRLLETNFRAARLPYIPNIVGRLLPGATRREFVEHLQAHVSRPVLWQRSIEAVLARHPDATLVEVGPRTVLYNLLSRKWLKNLRLHTDDSGSWLPHIAALAPRLRTAMPRRRPPGVACLAN